MASKTRTGLFQTPVSKPSPTTPKSKLDADSPSNIPRFSIDRASPKTTPSRPVSRSSSRMSTPDTVTPRPVSRSSSRLSTPDIDRASPKTDTSRPVSRASSLVSTPDVGWASSKSSTSRPVSRSSSRVSTDKSQLRINKPSELQALLQAAQDDLKKAKEKLVSCEKEKSQALNDLENTKKFADETNEKLQQALVAQKRAEESSEIEIFRAVELEQAGIETAQKKEEEWKKELESMKSQLISSREMTDYLTTAEELQRVKQELAMVIETKNQALAHADDATKIAEIHVEKVEFLSAEIVSLKGMLESKAGNEFYENGVVEELRWELGFLREELGKAKSFEQECIEKENCYEKNVVDLKSEMESVKKELDEAKSFEQELVEKEKSFTALSAELTSLEQKLLEANNYEQESVKKEKSYEKTIAELESNMNSLKQDIEKVKDSEQHLIEQENSRDVMITELMSEIDLLKHELEMAKESEDKLVKKEKLHQKTVRELELKLQSLKQELEVSRSIQEKLSHIEESYEQMNVELEASRMAESYALNLLDEWKSKAEDLEYKLAETTKLERSASESLESVMKQLEGNTDILHEAECEVTALKEKVALLEISLVKRKEDLEESELRHSKSAEEAKEAAEVIESIRSELETMKEEKKRALEKEMLAASNAQDILEEKNKLVNEVEKLKEEEEKSKMAMESLALALHEVSTEAREVKERLLSSQEEHGNFEAQIDHLQLVVKATTEKYESLLEDSKRENDILTRTMEQSKIEFDTQMKASNDKYESMLDEAKCEINHLTNILEMSKLDHENKVAKWEAKEFELLRMTEMSKSSYEESKANWEQKDIEFVNNLKRSEEEKSSMEKEITRLVNLVRTTEEKTIFDASSLKDALEEAETDCFKLRDDVRGKENELQNIMRENEQLRAQEDVNVRKINKLTKLLEQGKGNRQITQNGEISDSDKDYGLLPKMVEFSEENGHLGEKDLLTVLSNGVRIETSQSDVIYPEVHGKPMTPEIKENVKDEGSGSEAKMWESYKVDREFSTEMETEQGSLDDEVESKEDNTESLDPNGNPSENGSNSDSKQQKKKKPLYRKFGNLLRKGISSPK